MDWRGLSQGPPARGTPGKGEEGEGDSRLMRATCGGGLAERSGGTQAWRPLVPARRYAACRANAAYRRAVPGRLARRAGRAGRGRRRVALPAARAAGPGGAGVHAGGPAGRWLPALPPPRARPRLGWLAGSPQRAMAPSATPVGGGVLGTEASGSPADPVLGRRIRASGMAPVRWGPRSP